MNATLFMLTSAWMVGADPATTVAPAPAPAVVSSGSSCGGGCASACDSGCSKPGLWSRLKGRFSKGDDCCNAAPTCAPACAPAPVCKPAPIVHCKPEPACAPACKSTPVVWQKSSCDSCDNGCGKPGLWSRLKGRFSKGCDGDCNTCGTGCGTATPAVGHPEAIPAPKDKKEMPKDLPKGGVTNLQVEPIGIPVVAPRAPVIEVNGPRNPF